MNPCASRNKRRFPIYSDLRSSSLLEVDKCPTIASKKHQIEALGGDRYTMRGDLIVKGVTRPVTLAGAVYGEFNDPMLGHHIG